MIDFENHVNGKDLIILGPGKCLEKDCEDIDLNTYDNVIRFNSHWFKSRKKNNKDIFNRTDILFHNLMNMQEKEYEKMKEDNIILMGIGNILADENSGRPPAILNVLKKIQNSIKNNNIERVNFIPDSFIVECNGKINAHPTTGFYTILYLNSLDINSLTVAGIDFYDTYYHYNDNDRMRIGCKQAYHKSDIELEFYQNNKLDKVTFIGASRKKIGNIK
jgi:hypothetical protein